MIVGAAVVLLVVLLYTRGRVGPLTWAGREHLAGQSHPRMLGARPSAPEKPSPSEVLAGRLADGEITPDEYLERSALMHER
ncbi:MULTISPECIES: hypothetical protein [Aestuariimicrobium]|uniref:hypothetical protein n=1 Tax=Aestuariimicrobium TaxID=396388 RepID=UPI0003B58E04|nr:MULTISPECIES: hypothetical protein [Aestuariimicrobium]CAI9402083.1 hypothetical protein AESSP_00726 [Aestuariimicrobium sp. T2.26MG-19.2B]